MSWSSLLDVQVEEVVRRRKRARAIASASMGLAIFIIIVIMTIFLSPLLSPTDKAVVILLGAAAGALTAVAYYMLETYPELPESITVYGEAAGDTAGLAGIDAYIASELARNGRINVEDFARRYGIDRATVVSRLVELDRAGIVKIERVEAA